MRIPLPTPLESRDGSVAKDAKLLNAFVDGDDVVKRPAIDSAFATASGSAQGAISNNSLAYMINGDHLRSYNSGGTLQGDITL